MHHEFVETPIAGKSRVDSPVFRQRIRAAQTGALTVLYSKCGGKRGIRPSSADCLLCSPAVGATEYMEGRKMALQLFPRENLTFKTLHSM